jgi:hypothetical protein
MDKPPRPRNSLVLHGCPSERTGSTRVRNVMSRRDFPCIFLTLAGSTGRLAPQAPMFAHVSPGRAESDANPPRRN